MRFLSTLSLRRATVKNHVFIVHNLFLSTLSLRRATFVQIIISGYARDFYPRSPCGERPADAINGCNSDIISIHALLAESDSSKIMFSSFITYFYPRSPCGERRRVELFFLWCIIISIHALLAESDEQAQSLKVAALSISIHALLAESDSKSAQNSGALLRIWNKFYGDCIFMLTGKAVFYPFCPCFFHIFWCEGSGNFMIAFPSH